MRTVLCALVIAVAGGIAGYFLSLNTLTGITALCLMAAALLLRYGDRGSADLAISIYGSICLLLPMWLTAIVIRIDWHKFSFYFLR
jgi:hypothetical protein